MRHSLVGVLRGVVNQRLLERADGKGRVPATDVLAGTSKVLDAVAVPDCQAELQRLLAEGQCHGMQTLDQGLLELVHDGMVSLRDGLGASANPRTCASR